MPNRAAPRQSTPQGHLQGQTPYPSRAGLQVRRGVWLRLVLSLTGSSAAALTFGGSTPPWISGAGQTFKASAPVQSLKNLYAGRVDALLFSLPLPDTPRPPARVLQVPVGVYPVTVAYNLPGVNLRLSLESLCALFAGEIRLWNDSRLQRQNPAAALPALPVLSSVLTLPNPASLSLAQHCVGSGVWPVSRLKSSWSAGAVYLRPTLEFLQQDLGQPGTLALFAPGTLPAGAQVARLRSPDGRYVLPGADLGLTPPANPLSPRLPAGPADLLSPADQTGAYPLRGLVWAAVMQDQAYRGRSVAQARQVLSGLKSLQAGHNTSFRGLPSAFWRPIRLYFGGQSLSAVGTPSADISSSGTSSAGTSAAATSAVSARGSSAP